MSDDKAQQEPSMEDILASIRRILSEDEVEEKKAPLPEPAPMPKPAPAPKPAASPQDDIDALFANATPVHVPEPEPEPLPQDDIDAMFAQAAPEPEDDVLELTEDMVLDQPEQAFDMDQFQPDIDDFEPEPEPVRMPPPRRAPPRDEDDEESLISEPVAHHSTSLLSGLAREIVRQRTISLGNGGVTLESMVRELLHPILKEWLDENLPSMIERIVKKEIEKMVNRAENL